MIRRSLPAAAVAAALIITAMRVLGPPDPGLAAGFFGGGVPTLEEGEAVVSLLSWIVIVLVAVFCIGGTVRSLSKSELVQERSRRSVLVLVAGLLLLGVAFVHHELPQPSNLCCGADAAAIQEAARLAR